MLKAKQPKNLDQVHHKTQATQHRNRFEGSLVTARSSADINLSLWNVKATNFAKNTVNPIREIVDNLKIDPNPDKSFIPLSIGDPTIFGNLKTAPELIGAIETVVRNGKHNGYTHAAGYPESRQAICDYIESHQGKVTPSDVLICSGCSHSLDMCISALAERGHNILIPRPGFSIYRTLAEAHGIEVRSYNLLPERNWEIDLDQMEELIDENTTALILTNPSNPCGSVFTAEHILAVLAIAERHRIPIIADEIYEHFVFRNVEYHSISSLSKNVPVLSCGGLTKRFLVPGWRLGWIVIHDRNNVFQEIRKALANLSTRIIGSNTLVQGALPAILANTPTAFFDGLVSTLQEHAQLAYNILKDTSGLRPIMPSGAMYMMIGIDVDHFPEYDSELEFLQDLVKEQSVFCLPGQCFDYPNYFRIVLTVPKDMVWEACTRICEFCDRHFKTPASREIIENRLCVW